MASKPQVTLTFAGDATKIQKAADQAAAAAMGAGKDVAKAGKEFGRGAKFAQGYESSMTKVGVAVIATESAFNLAQTAISGLSDLQHRGERNAIELARAQGEVEQASLDAEQATIDLRQATEDLAQAQLDSKQAARDVAQAQLDVEQSMIDAEEASQDYRDAVREHGKGSLEARQALLDLKQAGEDTRQAQLDLEQANADSRQASIDASQAYADQGQAQRDAADAALSLREAQLAVENPSMNAYVDGLNAAASAASLLVLATDALKLSTIKTTAATVAAKTATLATSVATGVATAAQWLWNAAFAASGIGLIVIGIAALVAAIVWVATQTTWFQDVWAWAWGGIQSAAAAVWDWIKGPLWSGIKTVFGWIADVVTLPSRMALVAFGKMIDWFADVPGRLRSTFSGVASILSAPFRAAFNRISDAWNGTVGRLSWTVPDWVPIVGGNSISAPKLPKFHAGGVVPQVPGGEMLAVLQSGETIIPSGAPGGGASLRIEVSDTQAGRFLLQLLRNAVRTRGGDVQIAVMGKA